MGLTAIVTCMFFGAISGSGPATVAAIGALTIPAMIERGYDKVFFCRPGGCCWLRGRDDSAKQPLCELRRIRRISIGDLFMSGIVPGIMTGFVLMGYCYFYSRKQGWRGENKVRNLHTLGKASWEAKWALMVPVIVLGGGPRRRHDATEAAAIATFTE